MIYIRLLWSYRVLTKKKKEKLRIKTPKCVIQIPHVFLVHSIPFFNLDNQCLMKKMVFYFFASKCRRVQVLLTLNTIV
jgi:hypothetical protein